jgi:hypothetical protein
MTFLSTTGARDGRSRRVIRVPRPTRRHATPANGEVIVAVAGNVALVCLVN